MVTLQKNTGLVMMLVVFALVGFGLYLLNWISNDVPSREIIFVTIAFYTAARIGVTELFSKFARFMEDYQTRPVRSASKP
jgi:hypothetical protein